VLSSNVRRIESELAEDALALDVGGWASPWRRADWVIDVMPYETRGLYGEGIDATVERFGSDTWVQRDICSHEPWPFDDDQFDFVFCSHTLEDIRDPIWVCHELNRIAKAGYIEVPSRLEEQARGVHGPFVGWSHHHWLVDIRDGEIDFVFKPHALHGGPAFSFPSGFGAALSDEQRVQSLAWTGSFGYREVLMFGEGELDAYLSDFVADNADAVEVPVGRLSRLRSLLGRGR
jgi:SAM-dependent methyltransferase